MEMSHARISSALGVRPTPYVGDCASALTPMSDTSRKTLSVPIAHAPIATDPPWLNGVVEPGHAERAIERPVPILGDLRARRLDLADLVGAAREDLGLVSVPVPRKRESRVRHALRGSLNLRGAPARAAVGRDFDFSDGSAARPREASDLVEPAPRELVSAGRE